MMHTRTDTMSAANFWIHYVEIGWNDVATIQSVENYVINSASHSILFWLTRRCLGRICTELLTQRKGQWMCAQDVYVEVCMCDHKLGYGRFAHQCIYPIHWPNMRPVDKATQASSDERELRSQNEQITWPKQICLIGLILTRSEMKWYQQTNIKWNLKTYYVLSLQPAASQFLVKITSMLVGYEGPEESATPLGPPHLGKGRKINWMENIKP